MIAAYSALGFSVVCTGLCYYIGFDDESAVEVCADMHIDMCIDVRIHICVDMCMGMRIDICTDICMCYRLVVENVLSHSSIIAVHRLV